MHEEWTVDKAELERGNYYAQMHVVIGSICNILILSKK
jgi:hypothetical protein